MLIDKLFGVVENHFPYLQEIINEVKIFKWPFKPQDVLPKTIEGDLKEIEETFFLPFPAIAIEDKASCVVLFDMYKDQVGMDTQRGFMEYSDLWTEDNLFVDSGILDNIRSPEMQRLHELGYGIFTHGIIYRNQLYSAEMYKGKGDIFESVVASKKDIFAKDIHKVPQSRDIKDDPFVTDIMRKYRQEQPFICDYEDDDALLESFTLGPVRNAMTALQEVLYFNQPQNFILEEVSIKLKNKKKKAKKTLRSNQRPIYTLLRANEIRSKLGIPRQSPKIHERSGCWRLYKDASRYTKMLGKRGWVKPSWVGVSEKTVGKVHYRVVLLNR